VKVCYSENGLELYTPAVVMCPLFVISLTTVLLSNGGIVIKNYANRILFNIHKDMFFLLPNLKYLIFISNRIGKVEANLNAVFNTDTSWKWTELHCSPEETLGIR
jgi:hypothetical protein